MILMAIFSGCIGCIVGCLLFEGISKGFMRYRRPIIYKWEWKDINKFPIPEDEQSNMKDILYFDGYRIENCLIGMISHNKYGDPVAGYPRRKITHWAYFPSAPIEEIKNL